MTECRTHSCLFEDCDFHGASLGGSNHEATSFLNCRFGQGGMFGMVFRDCKLVGSAFETAQLAGLGITIIGGDWSYTNLRRLVLKGLDLHRVKFVEADLSECSLEKSDLREADLSRANLTRARLAGADLRGAILEGVDLKNLDLNGVSIDLSLAVAFARSHGAVVDPA